MSDKAASGEIHARARSVRLLVLDVDGVLTDGSLYYSAHGEELKRFHVQDGLGLKMLHASGVETAVITGRRSGAVELRLRELGVKHLSQGIDAKLAAFLELLSRLSLPASAAAGMGDDVPDLPILERCGLAVSVPNAAEPVRTSAHYVTRTPGGAGAVREVCELIMRAQGTLAAQLARYAK